MIVNFRRKKEALKAVSLAYIAGAHHIVRQVHSLRLQLARHPNHQRPEIFQEMDLLLEQEYQSFLTSPTAINLYIETLNEQGLYPFGSEWPLEVIVALVRKLIAPPVLIKDSEDTSRIFRFKKGFKEALNECATGLEAYGESGSSIDHWLAVLLDTAFHAACTSAARISQNNKIYFSALEEIENEIEPWTMYPQLVKLYDRQLSRETRRKSGLVRDFY